MQKEMNETNKETLKKEVSERGKASDINRTNERTNMKTIELIERKNRDELFSLIHNELTRIGGEEYRDGSIFYKLDFKIIYEEHLYYVYDAVEKNGILRLCLLDEKHDNEFSIKLGFLSFTEMVLFYLSLKER